jgi:hypothetical protein
LLSPGETGFFSPPPGSPGDDDNITRSRGVNTKSVAGHAVTKE